MKQSKYNFIFDHAGSKYVYNSLTTALAQLDDDVFDLLTKGDFDSLPGTILDDLTASGFIIDETDDEYEKYILFYETVRFVNSAKVLSITFIPTYNCNLSCPYCMQGKLKRQHVIDASGVYRLLKFARNQIVFSRNSGVPVQQINASLYGGEPTIAKDMLKLFCHGIREIGAEFGLPCEFSMTSNFTLIDDDFIDFIDEYQITTQVSIDGTPDEHDKRRIKRDGSGTYDIIISNLRKMKARHLEDLVVIRINIDKNNIEDAESIINSVEQYSTDVYFGFLDHFEGNNDCFGDCINREAYSYEVSNKLDKIMNKHGFPTNARFGKQAPCAVNSVNKFFVDCNLDVYKCEMLVSNPEMRVGYITEDGNFVMTSGYVHQMSLSPERYPECRDCKLLPMCGGGCAGKSYFKNSRGSGKVEKSFCNFTEYDLMAYLHSYLDMQLGEEEIDRE